RSSEKVSRTFYITRVFPPSDVSKVSLVAGVLRNPQRRERYDFFNKNGFPNWLVSFVEVTYVEGQEQIIYTPVSVQDLSRQSYFYFFSSPERSTCFTPSQRVATEHISIATSMKPKKLHG